MTYFLHLITEMKNAALRYVHFQGSLGGMTHLSMIKWLVVGRYIKGEVLKDRSRLYVMELLCTRK